MTKNNLCHHADLHAEHVMEVFNILPDVSSLTSIVGLCDLPLVLDYRLTLIGCAYALTSQTVFTSTIIFHWAIARFAPCRACASFTIAWFHA